MFVISCKELFVVFSVLFYHQVFDVVVSFLRGLGVGDFVFVGYFVYIEYLSGKEDGCSDLSVFYSVIFGLYVVHTVVVLDVVVESDEHYCLPFGLERDQWCDFVPEGGYRNRIICQMIALCMGDIGVGLKGVGRDRPQARRVMA